MFALELPIAAPMPAEGQGASATLALSQPLAGLCILVIDNEIAITEGMEALLGGWSCAVIKAANLEEAERLLKAAPRLPDGILADYHLDHGDGIEAIVALRWKLAPRLPAALLTADRSPDVRELAAGKSIHVLHKPLKPAALRALLAQWPAMRTAAE